MNQAEYHKHLKKLGVIRIEYPLAMCIKMLIEITIHQGADKEKVENYISQVFDKDNYQVSLTQIEEWNG